MAAAMARSPPTSQSERMSVESPRSRAMNPVVVKMPPPIMLLIKTQEAVNQPILEREAESACRKVACSLMFGSSQPHRQDGQAVKRIERDASRHLCVRFHMAGL